MRKFAEHQLPQGTAFVHKCRIEAVWGPLFRPCKLAYTLYVLPYLIQLQKDGEKKKTKQKGNWPHAAARTMEQLP
eukprot:scaffold14230_cov20-Tisochrysis_lutea.AAC.1